MIFATLFIAFTIITCISLCGDFNQTINELTDKIDTKWLRITVKILAKTIVFTFFIVGAIGTLFFAMVFNSSSSKDKK